VPYCFADICKESFIGCVGTCTSCNGIKQSAGTMSGKNVGLLLRVVKKIDEFCAGMLKS
jgi:hypothetical protein